MLREQKKIQYYEDIGQCVGKTPLVKINRVSRGYRPLILVKVEFFNPGGSVKDRIALEMTEDVDDLIEDLRTALK